MRRLGGGQEVARRAGFMNRPAERWLLPQKRGYHVVMNRSEAINKLKSCAEAIKERGATSLYLFGSAARDEARADSDLDLFIDYDPRKKFSLVDLVGIKH